MVPTPNENGDKKKKDESAVIMAVNQDSEVTAETKIDENDGGGTTCFIGVEIEKDVLPVEELPPEITVERWVADSGCSKFMTPSADYMVNYRESGGIVRTADGRAMPIEGIGSLPMSFWSGKDWVQVVLPNVAHVPPLGYNLLSLKRMGDRGHKYVGEKKGGALHLKNGKTLLGPSVGKLSYFSGFRRPLDLSTIALATIAPGKIPSASPVDINTFHTSHGHVHEKLLRSTIKQLGGFLGDPWGSARGARSLKVLANRSAAQLRQGPIRCLVVCSLIFVEKSLLSRSEESDTCCYSVMTSCVSRGRLLGVKSLIR